MTPKSLRVLLFLGIPLAAIAAVAAWVKFGHVRPTGPLTVVEYRSPEAQDIPTAIAAAPDGSVWFTVDNASAVGLVRDGKVVRIAKTKENVEPMGLATAADGSAWYTDAPRQLVVHVHPDGSETSVPLGTPIARLGRLALAPDGSVWFAENTAYSFTRVHEGKLERHVIDALRGGPFGITVDRSGTAWGTLQYGNRIARIGADGTMQYFDIPSASSAPSDIAVDANGAAWFIEFRTNQIGRLENGKFTEYRVPGERSGLSGLAIAPDGSVWFGLLREHALGRVRDGEIASYRLPRDQARPVTLAFDAKGNLWYADITGYVGHVPADEVHAR